MERDRIEFETATKKIIEAFANDKEKSRAFLVKAGIITPKGNFRKPYRHLCIPLEQD